MLQSVTPMFEALESRQMFSTYDITAYGAVANDGIDDTVAIQAAIDAADAAGGGTVYVPAGQYWLSISNAPLGAKSWNKALTIYDNITLQGESAFGSNAATLRLLGGQGNYGAIIAPEELGDDVSNFAMYDIHLHANGLSNIVPDIDAFNKQYQRDENGDGNNDFWDFRPRAGVALAVGDNIDFRDNRFSNGLGIWGIYVAGNQSTGISASNVSIVDNTFDFIGGGSVDFDSSIIYNVSLGGTINGNTFSTRSGVGTLGQRTAIEVHGVDQQVGNNTINSFAIGVNAGGTSYDGNRNVQVYFNDINNVDLGVVVWAYLPDVVGTVGMKDLFILHNDITLDVDGWANLTGASVGGAAGVSVDISNSFDGDAEDIIIRNNRIEFLNANNVYANQDIARYSNGIKWQRGFSTGTYNETRNLWIYDNEIINSPGAGVLINAPVDELIIFRNEIVNPGSSNDTTLWSGWRSGVWLVSDNLNNADVSENTIRNTLPTPKVSYGLWIWTDGPGTNDAFFNQVINAPGIPTVYVDPLATSVWNIL